MAPCETRAVSVVVPVSTTASTVNDSLPAS